MPLLVAMTRGNEAERALIRHAIEHGEVTRLQDVVGAVRRTGALDAAREVAHSEADAARRCLQALPASPYREALLELSIRSVDRSF